MDHHADTEAEGPPPSFLAAPAAAGYYFWYAHTEGTPWHAVPFIGNKIPIGVYAEPTGELEHAGGIHSVKLNDTLANMLLEEQPALALEWSATAGRWWGPYAKLSDFLSHNGDWFP